MLKFKEYKVKRIVVNSQEFNEEIKENDIGIFYKIIPNKKERFDKVNIIQGIQIFPSSKNKYKIEVVICGNFSLNREDPNFTEDILTLNCGAILYPYLRALVSLLSSQIDQKIILPPMNFYKFIENKTKDEIYGNFNDFEKF